MTTTVHPAGLIDRLSQLRRLLELVDAAQTFAAAPKRAGLRGLLESAAELLASLGLNGPLLEQLRTAKLDDRMLDALVSLWAFAQARLPLTRSGAVEACLVSDIRGSNGQPWLAILVELLELIRTLMQRGAA